MQSKSSALLWKSLVSAAKSIVEEATFTALPTGLGLRAMDPSHAAMVEVSLPTQSFESYSCETEEKFSLRLEDLTKVLARSDVKDRLELVREKEELFLKLVNGRERSFKVHTIANVSEPKEIKLSAMPVTLVIDKAAFDEILADAAAVGEFMEIEAKKEKLVFSGKSDSGEMTEELKPDDSSVAKLEVSAESRGKYSIGYLINVSRAIGKAQSLSVGFGQRMPLRAEFPLDQAGGKIVFYMAPRAD